MAGRWLFLLVESARVLRSVVLVCCLGVVWGCSPAYNWREVRAPAAPVVALMPCKPETAERVLPMLGPDSPPVAVTLWSCETQGVRFALALAPLPQAAAPEGVLRVWQRAAWAAVGRPASDALAPPAGWREVQAPFAGVVHASRASGPGVDHRGAVLQAHLAWAVQPGWVVQAAVYADRVADDVVDTFFTGVRFAQ